MASPWTNRARTAQDPNTQSRQSTPNPSPQFEQIPYTLYFRSTFLRVLDGIPQTLDTNEQYFHFDVLTPLDTTVPAQTTEYKDLSQPDPRPSHNPVVTSGSPGPARRDPSHARRRQPDHSKQHKAFRPASRSRPNTGHQPPTTSAPTPNRPNSAPKPNPRTRPVPPPLALPTSKPKSKGRDKALPVSKKVRFALLNADETGVDPDPDPDSAPAKTKSRSKSKPRAGAD